MYRSTNGTSNDTPNGTPNGTQLVATQANPLSPQDTPPEKMASADRPPLDLEPIEAMPLLVLIQQARSQNGPQQNGLQQDTDAEAQAEREAEAADLLRRADVYLMQGNVEAAIAHYRRALGFVPGLVDAHQGLAEALTQQGHLEEAAAHYQQAIALLPAPGEVTSESISSPRTASSDRDRLHRRSDQPASLDQRPWHERATSYLQQGKAHCDRQQWQDSIAACQQAADLLAPHLALTFRLLGRALQAEQQRDAAEQSYQQSIAIDPTVAETHARLGSLYQEQKRLPEAVAAFQRAIELDAEFAGAYLKLGEVWQQLGDSFRAADSLFQGYQLEPGWMTAKEHLQLGNLLMSQGKFEQASRCYRAVIERVPDSPNAYHNLAIALGKQQHWSSAVNYHQQALDRQPQNPRLLAALGQALTQVSRWQDAIVCYEQVIRLMPGYAAIQDALTQIERCQRALLAESYGNMADALAAEQQWQDAVHCYRQAIDRNPRGAGYHSGLAGAFVALKQWEQAVVCYREAIALEPSQSELCIALAELLTRLGRHEEATQYYRQIVRGSGSSSDSSIGDSFRASPAAKTPEAEAPRSPALDLAYTVL